jgi:peroxiredoxin
MPQLVGLANRFRERGLVILGISVDDPPAAIRAFAAEYGANYPMLVGLGQDRFLEGLGYQGVLPFTALVGADGRIVDRITGLRTTADWERRILRTLEAP